MSNNDVFTLTNGKSASLMEKAFTERSNAVYPSGGLRLALFYLFTRNISVQNYNDTASDLAVLKYEM